MDVLCHRRESLFLENVDTTQKLWENRGGIKEIQNLLANMPMLMVQYERWRQEQAAGSVDDADPAAVTAGLPQEDTTF